MRKCGIVYLTIVNTLFSPKLNCWVHKILQDLTEQFLCNLATIQASEFRTQFQSFTRKFYGIQAAPLVVFFKVTNFRNNFYNKIA